jgi:hypothetical protein
MNNMDIGQSLVETGNRRVVQDFRKMGSNPQDLRTTRRNPE